MAYQMYRQTTLGVALNDVLKEMVDDNMIPPALKTKVLATFDKNINKALAFRAKSKVHFKADKLVTYRFCDNVWTFVMKDVEFRDVNRSIDGVTEKVKFVACDGRASLALPSALSS